jgi:DNA replicative helicase MCM subunit Mcm2 (Cdc46/Mcm family)
VVKKTVRGYVIKGITTDDYIKYFEKIMSEDSTAADHSLRINMSSHPEKTPRHKHFNSIGIPKFIHPVLLGYILYIRDKVNTNDYIDLLVHSGKKI